MLPTHDQPHGPEPVTIDAVPDEHNPETGALADPAPFAGPQAPLIGGSGAPTDWYAPTSKPLL